MKALPRIADTEWLVMEFAWTQGEFTTADASATLGAAHGWSESTVKTLVQRLERKGALTSMAEGRRFRYRPAVRREDCTRQRTRGLAERLFGGATGSLLVHLVQDTDLSKDDIAALRRALTKKEEARRAP
jgi:BlaI family penicillinase repressor